MAAGSSRHERLKCKLCEFTTAKWRTGKGGKVFHGSAAMADHWDREHHGDFLAVMTGLMVLDEIAEYEEERNE